MTEAQGTVISVDAMGGDLGPAAVVKGMRKALRKHRDVKVLLHGPVDVLTPLIEGRRRLADQVEICDAPSVIEMAHRPIEALRNRVGTSMFNAVDAVRQKKASTVVSCGNTGALMAISAVTLKKLPGVQRPALAVFWPSLNKQMYNVVLDVGADIDADAEDLCAFAFMGAAYAKSAFQLQRPRVGLLNIGTEKHKGRVAVKSAADMMSQNTKNTAFEFVGFVEGDDIASDHLDVIVTDGFAGNIALKTAEGTASVINRMLRDAFAYSPLSRIASIFAITSMYRLKRRVDPRYSNGGVFLGLNGTVIKSHGSADSTGIAAALDLAIRLDQNGFTKRVSEELAQYMGPKP
ncbi:MAG: phosphate acyltransferase PlsX [Pseudomonadota bacterium]